ncbi:MAG: hypothetical protein ACRDFR_06645, partial [Candidatus Limnocylindria bacterium]
EHPCVWADPRSVESLPHLGGLGGEAVGINGMGAIVGTSELPDRASHAVVWSAILELTDIGAGYGYISGGRAIDDAGDVAGWVGVHPTERGQDHFRPAVWSASQVWVGSDLGGRWGEGVAMGRDGVVIGFAHDGRQASGWLRHRGGAPEPIATPGCASFWPLGITDDETVVGMCIGADFARRAIAIDAGGAMRPLDLARGAELTAISARGDVAGRIPDETGVTIPWVRRQGDPRPLLLPRLRDHHHSVFGMRGARLLVGVATADYCSHALLWRAP